MIRIAAVIPAYNEEKSIAEVVMGVNALNGVGDFMIKPVVVDDCSIDSTSEIIAALDCIDLHLPVNLGIGGAVQTGFAYAFENKFDYVVQIDGDGQHPAQAALKLVRAVIENNIDVVIGSRFIANKGFQSSLPRRAGISYFKWFNRFLLGIKITDCTSGLRILNRKTLAMVCDYYPDDYPEPESIVLFALNGLSIMEVPVIMKERQGGVSSISFLGSVYYMVKVSLAIIYTFTRIKFKK